MAEEEQEEDEERVEAPWWCGGSRKGVCCWGICACVCICVCMGMGTFICTCMEACCSARPSENLRRELLAVPPLPPPAELELVVAELDWREGVRRLRLGGALVVRIMGMVSPWQLRSEKRMGCCVGCLGRRQVQQYTATRLPTTTKATKMEPTIRKGT